MFISKWVISRFQPFIFQGDFWPVKLPLPLFQVGMFVLLIRAYENPLVSLKSSYYTLTLQGTNISHQKSLLKMIFLFPRWDRLIPWRVFPEGGDTNS